MAKISRLAGSTGHILTLFIQDSSSTTGAGLTGLAFNTANLTCYYKRNRGTASVAVTLANITTFGSYVSGGFKEIDAANMPGFFEFHPPDAALATGSGSVAFSLKGATNMAPCPLEIELTGTDNQNATNFGLANLDVTVSSRMATFTLPANFSSLAITGGGGVTASTVSDKTGYALTQAFPPNFASFAITAAGRVDVGNWLGNAVSVDANNLPKVDTADWGGVAVGGMPNSTTPPTAGAIATAIFQDLTSSSDFTTVGSFGKLLVTNLDTNVGSRMATFTLPTNFASLVITVGGAVTSGTNLDKTNYSLSSTQIAALVQAINQGNGVTSTVNDTSPSPTSFKVAAGLPSTIVGSGCLFTTGTAANIGADLTVTGYNSGTGQVTVAGGYAVAPATGDTCVFIGRLV